MPYKDAGTQKLYQRDWQRRQRSGEPSGFKVLHLRSPEAIQTAKGLLGCLSELIKEVVEAEKGDVYMKARTAGYLIAIGLKAVSTVDLEARLAALEDRILGSGREVGK